MGVGGVGLSAEGGPSGSALMQQQLPHAAVPANGIQLNPEIAPSPSSLDRVHRVEDVLPRDTAVYVVSLFFDFVSSTRFIFVFVQVFSSSS